MQSFTFTGTINSVTFRLEPINLTAAQLQQWREEADAAEAGEE
jgi:hypothetical protein